MVTAMASNFILVAVVLSTVELASAVLKVGAPVIESISRGPGFGGNAIMTSLIAFDSHGLDTSDLEETGSAIERLVTGGDDEPTKAAVKSMTDFIMKTMVPNREQSQEFDQGQLQSKIEAMEHCGLSYRAQNDTIFAEKVDRAKKHRVAHVTNKITHQSCLEVLEAHELLRDAHCIFTPHDVDDKCGNSTDIILPENKKCCDAHDTLKLEKDKCENVNYEIRYAKVQHKLIMNKLCSEYEDCFSSALRAYTDTEKLVKTHEQSRSWSTLLRVKCLVEDFKDGKVSKKSAKACEDKKYEVKKIHYPKVPSKAECIADIE